MDRVRVLITGGNGYIARSLQSSLHTEYDVTTITRKDFDLTNSIDTHTFFQGKYFDVVIHTAVNGGSRLKEETWIDADCNLKMYYNLIQQSDHYDKLIHFGSGAEIYNPESPYGMSKRLIANSMLNESGFYNLKVFGVFDENELDTRFIKANIKRYLNKEPMMIQNKTMTFFYMKDLITLVKHYIDTPQSQLLPVAHCAYANQHSMLEIANLINELDEHRVPIYMDVAPVKDYVSSLNAPYRLPYIGLEKGILNTYNLLK